MLLRSNYPDKYSLHRPSRFMSLPQAGGITTRTLKQPPAIGKIKSIEHLGELGVDRLKKKYFAKDTTMTAKV